MSTGKTVFIELFGILLMIFTHFWKLFTIISGSKNFTEKKSGRFERHEKGERLIKVQ